MVAFAATRDAVGPRGRGGRRRRLHDAARVRPRGWAADCCRWGPVTWGVAREITDEDWPARAQALDDDGAAHWQDQLDRLLHVSQGRSRAMALEVAEDPRG